MNEARMQRRHRSLRAAAFLAAVGLTAAPLAAQKPGSVEIGGFGRYTWFDTDFGLDNAFGGGGQLGVFVLPWLEIEGSGSYTPTNPTGSTATVKYLPVIGRLTANIPLAERAAILLGGGYARTIYKPATGSSTEYNAAHGLLGFRVYLASGLNFRAEGTVEYTPTQKTLTDKYFHFGAQAGLSYVIGKRPKDSDRDGVADGRDACPETPMGVQVDLRGCPVDSDHDGVADYQDRCANTPAGARVNTNGCPTDTDSDGVFDGIDKCPNTPAGAQVDATGCPKDDDGDGVYDGLDRCPNTPAGASVDASGCPLDSDKDGVIDLNDKCPNTPAGATVDSSGCPKDSDNDGVYDGLDRCPNSAAGQQVDAVGCARLFEPNKPTLVLQGVTFRTGSAELLPDSRTVLDIVAQSLIGNPEVRVEVAGHTDVTGSHALNMRLSQARAEAVMNYLISKGVPADRLTARGYGPDVPVATNATAAGRAQNRRVELKKLN
jgi:outer membrane protein OmpA-like peptidoglycan-associated protein